MPPPPLSAHGTYTERQLERLWVWAGGNPADERVAAAIAMAESGGNSQAVGVATSAGNAEGLWQIMMPLHAGEVPGSPFDARANARAAIAISGNGSNWQPWETYTTGAYLRYMPE